MRQLIRASALGLFLLTPSALAQDETPDLQRARELIAAQDFGGAADVLDALTRAEPDNARAWYLLGTCLHSIGDLEGALAMHTKAAGFEVTRAGASYNAACVHALQGRADAAFDWLKKARAAGFKNAQKVKTDSDLETLREDPRLADYLPQKPRSSRPFFEETVKVLHESYGEGPGDQYGWVARRVGDVDGDGIQDYASTAPTHGAGKGAVYVHSGKSGERLYRWVGAAGENYGWAVAGAGDVNGDGHDDVLIGAPGSAQGRGAAYVRSGADGSVLLAAQGEAAGDKFGKDLRGVGDLDGDGTPDLLIGAPGHDSIAQEAGRAYVLSGVDGSEIMVYDGPRGGDQFGESVTGWCSEGRGQLVISAPRTGAPTEGRLHVFSAITFEPLFVITPPATATNIAWFLSIIGDVDADGTPDIYHTDWNDKAKGKTTGRATVSSGVDGHTLIELVGAYAGEGFGIGVSDAGDLDGDGHDDLVIGAWQNRDCVPSGGKIYLYSGKTGEELGSFTGMIPGDTLGFDATSLGDVDGDGVSDLLITSAWNAANGAKTGRTYVISGASVLR